MQGDSPGMGYGPPAPHIPQAQLAPQTQPGPVPQGVPYAPPPRGRSRLAISLGAIAVLLAGAALVVSLVRKPEREAPAQSTPTATPTASAQAQIFVDGADRALCQAIAPLMKESNAKAKEFSGLASGSPEQEAAVPGYRTFTEDWAGRMQVVLNSHMEPPRFLTRTLQRFIDDNLLYTGLNMVSDPQAPKTWELSLSDYAGPRSVCYRLGVNW